MDKLIEKHHLLCLAMRENQKELERRRGSLSCRVDELVWMIKMCREGGGDVDEASEAANLGRYEVEISGLRAELDRYPVMIDLSHMDDYEIGCTDRELELMHEHEIEVHTDRIKERINALKTASIAKVELRKREKAKRSAVDADQMKKEVDHCIELLGGD